MAHSNIAMDQQKCLLSASVNLAGRQCDLAERQSDLAERGLKDLRGAPRELREELIRHI